MQLHEIKPKNKKKRKKRVGRGGKKGTYSGKGIKGQKSRAGHKMAPPIRRFIKRYPKLRGYRFRPKRQEFITLNVEVLERNFNVGDSVSPKVLFEKKLIRKINGRLPKIKILGRGDLSKKLFIKDCQFSKSAEEKVKKAGGKVK